MSRDQRDGYFGKPISVYFHETMETHELDNTMDAIENSLSEIGISVDTEFNTTYDYLGGLNTLKLYMHRLETSTMPQQMAEHGCMTELFRSKVMDACNDIREELSQNVSFNNDIYGNMVFSSQDIA